jgi:FkbM family methyltransferase
MVNSAPAPALDAEAIAAPQADDNRVFASFLNLFRTVPLGTVFADSSPVSARFHGMEWLNLPPEPFLDYARTRPRLPFDGVPSNPDSHGDQTTFLLAQSHRAWVTLDLIARHLGSQPGQTVLDLGSYPFALSIALNEYLQRDCRVIATVNQEIGEAARRELLDRRIETIPANLDPLVKVADPLPGMSDGLPLPDGSVDFAILAHVIEHLYHPFDILRETRRVLKPGGRFVITTDNSFMLGGLLNYLEAGRFLHEPVEGTAAMVFHEWRGHVRFYSRQDLETLLDAAGFDVVEVRHEEVLYNSFPEEQFVKPNNWLPKWRADLLRALPQLRNEIMVVGQARPMPRAVSVGVPAGALERDFEAAKKRLAAGALDGSKADWVDFAWGARMLWGRWPTPGEALNFEREGQSGGLDRLARTMMEAPAFRARLTELEVERPAHDCLVMCETRDKLRIWFSVRDTFVGFPVAVGVFERELQPVFEQFAKPGVVCLDIGANLGYYTVKMASLGATVYAFEPDPFNFHLLEKNVGENGLGGRVRLHRAACGSAAGLVSIAREPGTANYGAVHVAGAGEQVSAEVELVRVDVRVPQDVKVDFVKIDVEGFEPEALEGARAILERDRPAVLCEFNTYALEGYAKDAPARLLALMSSFGYRAYDAEAYGRGERKEFVWSGEGGVFTNLVFLAC